jgi:hypothetical protein
MRLIKATVAMAIHEEFHLNNIKPNTSNNGRARNLSHIYILFHVRGIFHYFK